MFSRMPKKIYSMSTNPDTPMTNCLSQRRMLEVLLDLSALAPEGRGQWLAFVRFAAEACGLELSIGEFSGLLPDSAGDFAYLCDSVGLTRKLLLNRPRIYIQPLRPPLRIDAFFYWQAVMARAAWLSPNLQAAAIGVTLVSSIFRGDEYLDGFLINSSRLQGYDDCQHFLIRAASPGNEHVRLLHHVREHPAAVYLNLATDPGLYQVWNLGVRLATGRYLSNANIDDRRAPAQLAHLQALLDDDTQLAAASIALRVSQQRNLDWDESADCPVWFGNLGAPVYAAGDLFRMTGDGLVSNNLLHCMPVWRRSLHTRLGEFDEQRYGPSADWAFWLSAGRHGARFKFSDEPLGLYLQDEASYWRRDATNRKFDARIVAEFGHLASSRQEIGKHEAWPLPPLSLEVPKILALLQSGAVLDALGRLLSLACEARAAGTATQALLGNLAGRFFACPDWAHLRQHYQRLVAADRLAMTALAEALTDLVHGFDLLAASACRQRLALACIDLEECLGDGRGIALLALLTRRCGDLAGEQAILQHLHDSRSAAFWTTVQAAYRFTRPLAELCVAVSGIKPVNLLGEEFSRRQVVFYPDYRRGNVYQGLLYQPLLASGAELKGTSDEQAFLTAEPLAGAENILHLHWVTPLFGPWRGGREVSARLAGEFMAGLIRQKQRGFRLYWTIHNRLSHESVDPDAEIAFRRELYRLADRVFVHHPLAADLLEWLPDREKLHLCEHGRYDLPAIARISREDARAALGFADNDWVVTHIGQVRDYKGLGKLLPELWEHLLATPRMKLVIAGPISSAAAKAWLAAHHHPRLIVHDAFLSEEDLNRQMRAADVGLLSYNAILTSGSLFHWFSCARTILAPRCGTIPGYLVNGWNGLIYDDHAGLREALDFAAGVPPEELVRMGNNALATVSPVDWTMWAPVP